MIKIWVDRGRMWWKMCKVVGIGFTRRREEPLVGCKEGEEKWALVLFSGTGSVKHALENMGYHVVSVDWDPSGRQTWWRM